MSPNIITENTYLQSLIPSHGSDYYEMSLVIEQHRILEGHDVAHVLTYTDGGGCDTVIHAVYHIKDKGYYVYLTHQIGSDAHCCGLESLSDLVSRGTIYTDINELEGYLRSLSYVDLEQWDLEESLRDLQNYITSLSD